MLFRRGQAAWESSVSCVQRVNVGLEPSRPCLCKVLSPHHGVRRRLWAVLGEMERGLDAESVDEMHSPGLFLFACVALLLHPCPHSPATHVLSWQAQSTKAVCTDTVSHVLAFQNICEKCNKMMFVLVRSSGKLVKTPPNCATPCDARVKPPRVDQFLCLVFLSLPLSL